MDRAEFEARKGAHRLRLEAEAAAARELKEAREHRQRFAERAISKRGKAERRVEKLLVHAMGSPDDEEPALASGRGSTR
jgi:hypothetical protein